jgi:hypothetical protein
MPTSRLLRSFLVVPSIATVALVAPRAVRAQQSVAWTLCTPGTLNACSSVQLSTTAIYSGATRMGTDVTVTMHNLQGRIANDNTLWSALAIVMFSSSTSSSLGYSAAMTPLSLSGGATEANPHDWWIETSWWAGANAQGAAGPIVSAGVPTIGDMIGGCTPGMGTVVTCGANATASLSLTSNDVFDASSFDGVAVQDYVYYRDSWAGVGIVSCTAGAPPLGPGTCNVLSESVSVTPEPVSMSLVATGFLGIAGVGLRLRRRRRPLG